MAKWEEPKKWEEPVMCQSTVWRPIAAVGCCSAVEVLHGFSPALCSLASMSDDSIQSLAVQSTSSTKLTTRPTLVLKFILVFIFISFLWNHFYFYIMLYHCIHFYFSFYSVSCRSLSFLYYIVFADHFSFYFCIT